MIEVLIELPRDVCWTQARHTKLHRLDTHLLFRTVMKPTQQYCIMAFEQAIVQRAFAIVQRAFDYSIAVRYVRAGGEGYIGINLPGHPDAPQ